MKQCLFVTKVIVTSLQRSAVFCVCKVRHGDCVGNLLVFRMEGFGGFISLFYY